MNKFDSTKDSVNTEVITTLDKMSKCGMDCMFVDFDSPQDAKNLIYKLRENLSNMAKIKKAIKNNTMEI